MTTEPDSKTTGQEVDALAGLASYYIARGEGSRHEIFPGVEIRTTAGKNMMISVVTFEPHSVVLEHAHPHEQMGILVSGRLEFTVGGVTQVLGPGEIWRSRGAFGIMCRALDEPAVAVDVFHPIREDYL